ncbi:MAG TPA: ABC transporter ATP-binding protein [Solirubrobacteraceae bacterium]|jgi:branched-chain amino acid transport system ATP-binding protein|nr:ABC transporter ATP-binding protein [Solirubrobacteraceae bacterium]
MSADLKRPVNGSAPARPATACALAARGVVRSFGGVNAVDGVGLQVETGTVTGIIGPNGAGKSTFLNVLAGSLKPSSGSVFMGGRDVTGLAPHQRARRGLIRTYQISSEFRRLTVLENLLVAAPHQRGEQFRVLLLGKRWWRAQEAANHERAWELLSRFGLTDLANEYAGELSGGQRRLVEIIRSLMADPKTLLLDEPMAGVNPTMARTVERHLRELGQEGLTMVIVEHELAVLGRLCERVVVMAEGRVIADGEMAEVRARPEVIEAYVVG